MHTHFHSSLHFPPLFSWQYCILDALVLIHRTWCHAQPFVTELDLRVAHIPAGTVAYLREAMPSVQAQDELSGETGEGGYDYEEWLNKVFSDA